tara:strand:+ start:31087 stop:31914 length:828 start_codon:yes stop_codon:yes gene_type:complete
MKLMSTGEFVSHNFPTPSFLVDPILPQGGTAILHGKPNVGKTQFVMTLSYSITNGLPLFGRWPVRSGPVVIIQADMTGQIQQARVHKVVSGLQLNEVYWLVEEDGSQPIVNIINMPMTHAQLVEEIQNLEPVLIVWDTLRKIHTLSENSSESAVAVYNAARKVCRTATHLFIHHNRKESRDPDLIGDPAEDMMGNQQWMGACDTTLSLAEIGSVPKRLALQIHKARTADELQKKPFSLTLDMDTMLLLPTYCNLPEGNTLRESGFADEAEALRWP